MYQQHREQFLCCARRQDRDKERTLDGIFYTRPVLIGNNVLLFGRKDSTFPQQCLVGPDWPCMLITCALIVVPTVFFLINVASALSPAVVVLGVLSCVGLLSVFLAAACSDPGIVFAPLIINSSDNDSSSSQRAVDEERAELAPPSPPVMQCSQCFVPRPASASHCYECNVCVDHLDHHCPWTGKCIGAKNIRFFYAFLWMLCIHIALVIASCVYAWATAINVFAFPKE